MKASNDDEDCVCVSVYCIHMQICTYVFLPWESVNHDGTGTCFRLKEVTTGINRKPPWVLLLSQAKLEDWCNFIFDHLVTLQRGWTDGRFPGVADMSQE